MLRKLNHFISLLSDWRWLIFYFQRLFKTPDIRERFSAIISRHLRPAPVFRSNGSFVDVVSEQKAAELKTKGIVHLGELLNARQVEELVSYFEKKPVCDHYKSKDIKYLPLSSMRDLHSHTSHHEPYDIINAPYLLSLANNPDILNLVEKYLGCKATIGSINAWWSYCTAVGPKQAEFFHRDLDDWRFIKLFLYLTDVSKTTGPHVYVLYSANNHALTKIRRYLDTEIYTTYGNDSILELTGKAGYGFLENTYGIHKGQHLQEGHRLIFQVTYSMFPLPYSPKRPILSNLPDNLCNAEQIDPYVNRLFIN